MEYPAGRQIPASMRQTMLIHRLISTPDTDKATDLCNRIFYDLLSCQIRLVTNEELVNSLRGISVNLLQPLLNIGERVYR
jgi:hypothetical protein